MFNRFESNERGLIMYCSFKHLLLINNNSKLKAWKSFRSWVSNRYPTDSVDLKNTAIRLMQNEINCNGDLDALSEAYIFYTSHLVNNPKSRFYIYG